MSDHDKTPDASPATDDHKTTMISLDLLDADPTNRRDAPTDAEVEERANQLNAVGQLQPILVRPEGERFRIVFGHVRVLAAKKLGWASIRAEVQALDDKEAKRRQVIENLARKDPSPYQQALQFQDLLELGEKPISIARLTSKSLNTVKDRLKLLELPETIGRRVDQKGFSMKHAKLMLQLSGNERAVECVMNRLVDPYEEVAPMHMFLPQVIGLLADERIIVDLTASTYRTMVDRDAWNKLCLDHGTKVIKHDEQSFAVALDGPKFLADCEALLAKQRQAEEVHNDPNVDPEEGEIEEGDEDAPKAKRETKKEKADRLAAEAERLKQQKREEALRAKTDKLVSHALVEAVSMLTPEQSSFVTLWTLYSQNDFHTFGRRLELVVAEALGMKPGAARKMLEIDAPFEGETGTGIIVPPAWLAADETQRTNCVNAIAALRAIECEGLDSILGRLTPHDEEGWHAQAEAPKGRKSSASDEPSEPDQEEEPEELIEA